MPLLRYVCSLPNPGTKGGAIRELFYPDNPEGRARAEKFARHENKPGRGVYDCIGRLQDGARSRRKDTVADLDQIVADPSRISRNGATRFCNASRGWYCRRAKFATAGSGCT